MPFLRILPVHIDQRKECTTLELTLAFKEPSFELLLGACSVVVPNTTIATAFWLALEAILEKDDFEMASTRTLALELLELLLISFIYDADVLDPRQPDRLLRLLLTEAIDYSIDQNIFKSSIGYRYLRSPSRNSFFAFL